MSILTPTFLKEPFTVIRNRYHEINLYFYESFDHKTQTGVERDMSIFDLVCDFKYDADDVNPVFTIEGPSSPASITISGGKVTLILSEEDTKLFSLSDENEADFPFRVVFFEVKGIDDQGRKQSLALGRLFVYKDITRSDDGP